MYIYFIYETLRQSKNFALMYHIYANNFALILYNIYIVYI